jgi:hypothetical protein
MGIEQGSKRFVEIMSDGVGEITREFTTPGEYCDEKDMERFDYIFNQTACLLLQKDKKTGELTGVKRDLNHDGQTLDDFARTGKELAQLTKAQVLALRLYTSNSYWRINKPLRDGCTADSPHPYAATTYYIYDAIRQLRGARRGEPTATRTFWRGMDVMGDTDEFLKHGGTEMACVSTTEDLSVARKYAKIEGPDKVANPLLLRVQSNSLFNCGADIQWLSMYPEEREVLFPPLTYLRPMGEPVVEDGCRVITVQPQC